MSRIYRSIRIESTSQKLSDIENLIHRAKSEGAPADASVKIKAIKSDRPYPDIYSLEVSWDEQV